MGSRVLSQGLAQSAPCPPPGFTSSPPASAPHAALSPGPFAETSYTCLSTVICEALCLFPWIFSTTTCVSYIFQLPSFYFLLHWVFVVVHKLSLVAMSGLSFPVACGILVPQSGTEPVSPALEGRFLTTGPPGKSQLLPLNLSVSSDFVLLGHLAPPTLRALIIPVVTDSPRVPP